MKFLKNVKNAIFWFLKCLLINLLELSTLLMAMLSCMSLGYFVGIMLKTNMPLNIFIEIGVFVLLISAIFFPLFQFYLIPTLRIKWKMLPINSRSFTEIGNRAFIHYYQSKKDIVKNNQALEGIKHTDNVLCQFLLKIPIFKWYYIRKKDFKTKMEDSAFAIGYTLKWIKRKAYFGFGLFFILSFIISTGIFILLPDYFFYILYGLFLITPSFLLTLHVDLYILKKHYRQFDREQN